MQQKVRIAGHDFDLFFTYALFAYSESERLQDLLRLQKRKGSERKSRKKAHKAQS
jgi:hypothetical protein